MAEFLEDLADGHIFLLHADEVHRLALKAGLHVDKLELFTNSLTNGHVKLGRALKLLPRALVNRIEELTRRIPSVVANRLMVQMAVRLQRPVDVTYRELASAA